MPPRRVDLWADDHERAVSADSQRVLRALRSFDDDRDDEPSPDAPATHSISEVPIRWLAREANLSVERTRAAVDELVARQVPGLARDGDRLVLRT